ncbi:MAG: lytic transglycosylase domain-containing protein [Oscillospiraceae bacterium]
MKQSPKTATIKIGAIILIFVTVISLVVFVCYKSVLKVMYPQKNLTLIEKYADEYDVDDALVYAVIKTESGYNPQAESDAGALGLTQITPETFRWLQTKTGEKLEDKALLESETSIKYGCVFLGMLLDEFGDTKTAIAAYHAGRGSVHKWLLNKEYSIDGKSLDIIPSKDTAHYVSKVTKSINIYKNLYDI